MAIRYEFLFYIRGLLGADMRLWTGEGELDIGGHSWNTTNIVSDVTLAGGQLSGAETRIQIELFALDDATRLAFLTDPGPVQVTIQQVASTDDGMNWALVPRSFTGRLSSPELVGDRYRIDIIDRYGDPLRPLPRYWSDEDQRRRFPQDQGLKYMRAIAAGVDVRWP